MNFPLEDTPFVFIPSPDQFESEPHDHVLRVRPSFRSLSQLQRFLLEELHSQWLNEKPNWQNVSEALGNLQWTTGKRLVLLHPGLPGHLVDRELAGYFHILIEAMHRWRSEAMRGRASPLQPRTVLAVFPSRAETDVQRLLVRYPYYTWES